ncbi:MAG: helix-turn-helix transcriptional regulator [Limisphaerales bacterium]
METLSAQDCRKLMDCVADLYAHHDLDGFAARLLVAAQKVIGADYTTFTELNERFKRVGCISSPINVIPKPTPEQQSRYFGEHPLWLHFTKCRFTTPAKISDYVPRHRYRQSAFYKEIFRALGVEAMMASSPINPRGGIVPAVAFIRSLGDFSERDRLKLALLHPHIHGAYAQAEWVSVLGEQNALMSRTLAAVPHGLVVLSPRGAISLCNEKARLSLERYFERPPKRNRLPQSIEVWLRRQALPAAKNGNALPPARQPFVVQRRDGWLTIHLISGQAIGERILLMREQRPEIAAALLREHLGLTARQAEVLFWVAEGKANADIAIILGMSAATVEKHLEHVLARLMVETRTAAARCAHELLSRN